MEIFSKSATKHAGTVFVMAACIVLFFLLITPEEEAEIVAPFFRGRHFTAILLIAFMIIAFTAVAGAAGWNLNPHTETRLDKVVTIESMENQDTEGNSTLCDKHKSSPSTLEECCKELTDLSGCVAHSHCGWMQTKVPLSVEMAHTGVERLHSQCTAVTETGTPHFKNEFEGMEKELHTKYSLAKKKAEDGLEEGWDKLKSMF